LATQILRDDKSNRNQVHGAVSDLQSAERYFTYLAVTADAGSHHKQIDRHLASTLAAQCSDLLKQVSVVRSIAVDPA
jgi:hypothetical protein